MAPRALLLLPVLLLAACTQQGERGRTPSGLPVPRYVSLKFDEVNGRNGPSEENRLLWTYRAKGLPVQVVAETSEWRRICDPSGSMAWVHKRGVDGVRTALNNGEAQLSLLDKPRVGAATKAYLLPGAVAELDQCAGGWCRLKAGGRSGWVLASEVWGAAEAPQCR